MHNNYHFFQLLVPCLEEQIRGMKVGECFTQQKNELIIGLYDHDSEFFIRADLKPAFTCLSFPEKFARARKNSVDLFPGIVGEEVQSLTLYNNERCFSIDFKGQSLLFKMFGSRSNLILFKEDHPSEIFRNSLTTDLELRKSGLHRAIDQSEKAFLGSEGDLRTLFPTLGKPILDMLSEKGFPAMDLDQKWKVIKETLDGFKIIYVNRVDDKSQLSLVKNGVIEEFEDPVAALNYFYSLSVREKALENERKPLIQTIQQEIKRTQNYISKSRKKLNELSGDTSYKELADILMANIHQVPANAKKARLFNFYNNEEIDIKLNPNYTVQKNAENYYRKSKNQKIEVNTLKNNLELRSKALSDLNGQLEYLNSNPDLKSIREFKKKHGYDQGKTQTVSLPYNQRKIGNYEILIGKNALSNDILTFKIASRNDLWLHARDVPGSHVIIRDQPGRSIPSPVIEKAASLAAFHSKRKNDSLIPVIVVERKYVRKFKGAKAGQVKVDHEKVILVKPERT